MWIVQFNFARVMGSSPMMAGIQCTPQNFSTIKILYTQNFYTYGMQGFPLKAVKQCSTMQLSQYE